MMQARRQPGAELQSLLSCGKPCYRKLPECPHHCEAICHLGECPASSSCQKEVTVSFHPAEHQSTAFAHERKHPHILIASQGCALPCLPFGYVS